MLKGIIAKSLVTAVLVFGSVAVRAQEAPPAKASCSKTCTKGEGMKKKAFMESLSEEQKQAYMSLKENKKASRAALEATFSPEQLAVVNNQELDKKAKKEALKATFTDAQKQQREANKAANKSAKEAFVASLSDEQKALMPERRKGKGKKACKKGKGEQKG